MIIEYNLRKEKDSFVWRQIVAIESKDWLSFSELFLMRKLLLEQVLVSKGHICLISSISKHPSIIHKYLLAIWFLASVKYSKVWTQDYSYRVVIFTSIAVNCDISVMSSYAHCAETWNKSYRYQPKTMVHIKLN